MKELQEIRLISLLAALGLLSVVIPGCSTVLWVGPSAHDAESTYHRG